MEDVLYEEVKLDDQSPIEIPIIVQTVLLSQLPAFRIVLEGQLHYRKLGIIRT